MSEEQSGRVVRLPRLRLGVLAKIYTWGTVALVLGFLLTIVPLFGTLDNFVRQQHENAATATSKTFETVFERANQDLASVGAWLVKQPDVITFVRARDGDGLARLVAPAIKLASANVIVVSDSDSVVLATLRSEESPAPAEAKLDSPGVKKALAGTESQQLIVEQNGRLQWQRVFPVYDVASRPPIGAIAVGFYLSGEFLKGASAGAETQIAILSNGQIVATTLADNPGAPWTGRAVPESIAAADTANRFSAPLTLATDKETYDFRFKSLRVSGATAPLLYAVGTPHTDTFANAGMLVRVVAVELIGGLFILGVAGYFVTRSLLAPIHELDTAARAMASGDLSTAIRVKRRDELGDLAQGMEAMRQQLSESMQSLAQERNRFTAAVRSMGAAAVMTDQKGRVASVNYAAEALLKQDQDSLLGLPWQHIFVASDTAGDSTSSFWSVNPASTNGDHGLIVRGRFPLRDRPRTVLDIVSSPVEVDGVSTGYLHILQDSSALEQLTRAKDELLLNVAHELRAPLTSLRTSIDLLIEDYAVMSKHDFGVMLRTLRRSIVKFQGLVENLIDVGRLQSGHFRVQPVSIDFSKLLQDAIGQVEPILQTRNQTLDLSVACSSPCLVLADRARIIQVIINLLSNASKYSPENQTIGVSAYIEGGRVYLEVADHGQGITPEEQVQLFQRFYRTKRAEEEGAGVGLGLALSKGIVEAHGGQIGLRSQPGSGATFWFSLETISPNS